METLRVWGIVRGRKQNRWSDSDVEDHEASKFHGLIFETNVTVEADIAKPASCVFLGTVQGGQTWHGQTLGGQLSRKKSSVYVLLTPSKESGGDLFWLGLVLARLVTVRDP